MTITIRPATSADLQAAIDMDAIAVIGSHRRNWLAAAFAGEKGRIARLALIDDVPAGFMVSGEFFSNPFVDLLITDQTFRRRGVAAALLGEIEALSANAKLFISTNRSNLVMQELLARRGYLLAGEVDHLDEGDPELFFVKRAAP